MHEDDRAWGKKCYCSVVLNWWKTNGSIAIYPSKEVFEKLRVVRDETRGETKETGITMFYKVVGHIKAERLDWKIYKFLPAEN